MISIKEKLIERIKANEDEELLREIFQLLESEDQEPLQLTEKQKNKINESQEAYLNGKTVSDDEVQKRLDKWLGK